MTEATPWRTIKLEWLDETSRELMTQIFANCAKHHVAFAHKLSIEAINGAAKDGAGYRLLLIMRLERLVERVGDYVGMGIFRALAEHAPQIGDQWPAFCDYFIGQIELLPRVPKDRRNNYREEIRKASTRWTQAN